MSAAGLAALGFQMLYLINIVILVALVKLQLTAENPLLCAGLYAWICAGLGWMSGIPLGLLALYSVLKFGVAFAYFWLLERFEGSGVLWWAIFASGFLIVLVVT